MMVYTSNDKPSGVMGSCETIFFEKKSFLRRLFCGRDADIRAVEGDVESPERVETFYD